MIESKGKNRFENGVFDAYEWSASIYETPEELIAYINSLDLYGKTISSVRIIGALIENGLGNWKFNAIDKLEDAGIIDEYLYLSDALLFSDGSRRAVSECMDLLGNVRTALNVRFCEPFIICFTDGTSLEILPDLPKGIRASYCSIPSEIRDGINRSEFEISDFFGSYVSGSQFRSFEITENLMSINALSHSGHSRQNNRRILECRFDTSDKTIIVSCNGGCSASLSLSTYIGMRCCDLNIPSLLDYKQIPIFDCDQGGGAVNIFACKAGEKAIYAHISDCFSVGYMIPELAFDLMDKYYDVDINPDRMRKDRLYNHYDANYYSLESATNIAEDLFKLVEIARMNPGDERCHNLYYNARGIPKDDYIRDYYPDIFAQIDYAERFAKRLSDMTRNASDSEYIVVMGP